MVFTVRLVLIVIYDNLWATTANVNGFSGKPATRPGKSGIRVNEVESAGIVTQ